MDVATELFIKGFGFGVGVGSVVLCLMVGWSAFQKSVNSV